MEEKNILIETTNEEQDYHDNVYEIMYIDDIQKEKYLEKRKKKKEEEEIQEIKIKNKKINKMLNILIILVSIGIVISIINLAFPEKIQEIKAPIEAYFINKKIEKEASLGNIKPAGEYESEIEEFTENITWNELEDSNLDTNTVITNNPLEKKAISFAINDETIYNFNENIIIKIPDEAYVQSTNDEKVLMLNAEKVYNIILNCKAYEVKNQNGKFYLIIHSEITNKNYPKEVSLQGFLTTKINNEIITSNKNNIKIPKGETKKVEIYSPLTENQYKLIRDELNNLDLVYKDSYNYREIFATYGGNYLK